MSGWTLRVACAALIAALTGAPAAAAACAAACAAPDSGHHAAGDAQAGHHGTHGTATAEPAAADHHHSHHAEPTAEAPRPRASAARGDEAPSLAGSAREAAPCDAPCCDGAALSPERRNIVRAGAAEAAVALPVVPVMAALVASHVRITPTRGSPPGSTAARRPLVLRI